MIVIRSPARRIALAIVVSLLVHAAIFFLPHIQLPGEKLQLPPLTINLQPLPKLKAQLDEVPAFVNRTSKPDDKSMSTPTANPLETVKEMEKSAKLHLFPEHLMLKFDVYKGGDIFRVAEIKHQLDIQNGRYCLYAIMQTTDFSSLYNDDQLSQISQGKMDEQGLHPDTYREEKITKGRKQSLKAAFDWKAKILHFAKGGEVLLTEDAQDILSFMYQLSQLSMRREIIPLSITDGENLDKYQIEIGSTEDLVTPMGNLHALHLRKMHSESESYFEIWLGQEYRLLPVKFRQIDGTGKVIEELVITDIRASGE